MKICINIICIIISYYITNLYYLFQFYTCNIFVESILEAKKKNKHRNVDLFIKL